MPQAQVFVAIVKLHDHRQLSAINFEHPNGYVGVADRPLQSARTAASPTTGRSTPQACMTGFVKGFGRLRTKASSAGTRGPHALVYG